MPRLVVVSNRVAPISEGEPTAGGLAAGVMDALKQKGGIWFGWSGEINAGAESLPNPERTVGAITLYTVDLSRRDYDEFYRGFANGALWPALHYQIGLVRAMCHYDLLGFQTETDRTAFADYVQRWAGGAALEGRRLSAFGRTVHAEVYPIGVHVDEIRAQAETPTNRRTATRMRASLLDNLILSVDRLDYSKGLRQRFGSFERFLQDYPAWHGNVTFMQIAPPSRADIQTYREIRRELEAEAGRINGRFAEVDWVPLRYLNKGFPRNVLMPLYAEAQIGLVTPLRDGMNLVAKEYAAAQDPEDPGVLVLSQFAGAAAELDAALLVNPYDEAGIAAALDRGLAMPREERCERHAAMLAVMRRNNLDTWRDRFVADLAGSRGGAPGLASFIQPGVAMPTGRR